MDITMYCTVRFSANSMSRRDETRPNVLLIVMDSVRARNTSLHGYERETTPELERFAERSTVYTQARAPSNKSIPSHASIFTGLNAVEHQLFDSTRRLRAGNTVWEELSDQYGYQTCVISGNEFLIEVPIGLNTAFQSTRMERDVRLPFPEALDPLEFFATGSESRYGGFLASAVETGRPIRSLWNGLILTCDFIDVPLPKRLKPSEVDCRGYTRLCLDWISSRDAPWAACINYMDAHLPYLPIEGHNAWGGDRVVDLMNEIDSFWEFHSGDRPIDELEALEDLYDGCIHQVDSSVGHLLARLESMGELEDTLVVITSDHGEGFGERDPVRGTRAVGHGVSGGLHEMLFHVPLLVKYPGQDAERTTDRVVSLTHFPSVVDAVLDGNWDYEAFVTDGPVLASMGPLAPREEDTVRGLIDDVTPFEYGGRVVYEDSGRGVVKHVRWNSKETKILCRSAREREPLPDDDAERVDAVFEDYSDRDVLADEGVEISDSTRQQLEKLGYV